MSENIDEEIARLKRELAEQKKEVKLAKMKLDRLTEMARKAHIDAYGKDEYYYEKYGNI